MLATDAAGEQVLAKMAANENNISNYNALLATEAPLQTAFSLR